jgi:uncharacterized protein YdeI (YjbR/CyaY-like superfamily)
MKTLDVRTRGRWRAWLAKHHDSVSEVWLVFHKQHTGRACLSYDDAVEEALCFGWVDSLIKRLDDERFARKFTPRKADSRWSTANRRRYAKLKAAGLMTAVGLKRPPTSRSGDAPQLPDGKVPAYIERELRASPAAWRFFEQLAPSYRRLYCTYIDSAKREETKRKRLQAVISELSAGRKPGMK